MVLRAGGGDLMVGVCGAGWGDDLIVLRAGGAGTAGTAGAGCVGLGGMAVLAYLTKPPTRP